MIEVHFSPQEISEAKRVAKERYGSKEGLDSTIAGTKDFNVKGILGEWAFKKYLVAIGATFTESQEGYSRHGSDKFDFVVGVMRTDVKSSAKWRGIAMNDRQRRLAFEKKTDILVSVHLTPSWLNIAEVVGYGFPRDLIRDPRKDFTYKGELKEMWSIPHECIRPFKVCDLIVPEMI